MSRILNARQAAFQGMDDLVVLVVKANNKTSGVNNWDLGTKRQ